MLNLWIRRTKFDFSLLVDDWQTARSCVSLGEVTTMHFHWILINHHKPIPREKGGTNWDLNDVILCKTKCDMSRLPMPCGTTAVREEEREKQDGRERKGSGERVKHQQQTTAVTGEWEGWRGGTEYYQWGETMPLFFFFLLKCNVICGGWVCRYMS